MSSVRQSGWLFIALGWISLVVGIAGCDHESASREDDGGLVSVRLALNWYPEAEHGGYIAINVHRLYDERRLKVDVLPGDTGAPQTVLAELAAGRVEFAISDADNLVKARSRGVPLVALLAPLQMTPRCIMVHSASGIESLEELANVQLAISEARPFALWMKKKLPLTNVTMVPYSGGVGEFLTRQDFAQQAFVFSEPYLVREQGGDPRSLLISDIGFNPYACLLVTTESMIEQQEDIVRMVVQACQRGWAEYLVNPEQTNAEIAGQNSTMTPAVLEFGAEQLKSLCQTDGSAALGGMTLERWETLVRQIEELNEIPAGSVSPSACFTTKFLTEME